MSIFIESPKGKRYKELLGEIVVEIAEIEAALVSMLTNLIGEPPELMDCLIGGDTLDMLVTKFDKYIRFFIAHKRVIVWFEPILKEIVEIKEQRNAYIHSTWDLYDLRRNAYRSKVKMRYSGKSIYSKKTVPIKELEGFLLKIQFTNRNLLHYPNHVHKIVRSKVKRRRKAFEKMLDTV